MRSELLCSSKPPVVFLLVLTVGLFPEQGGPSARRFAEDRTHDPCTQRMVNHRGFTELSARPCAAADAVLCARIAFAWRCIFSSWSTHLQATQIGKAIHTFIPPSMFPVFWGQGFVPVLKIYAASIGFGRLFRIMGFVAQEHGKVATVEAWLSGSCWLETRSCKPSN